MANPEQLGILGKGVETWNQWRETHPRIRPDLKHAHLSGQPLLGVNFSHANLVGALLMQADLTGADLHCCDLTCANLMGAILNGANLDLADLFCANFTLAKLQGALLRQTNLMGAVLVETDLTRAQLSESRVYGVSAWNAKLDGAAQGGLIVTAPDQPEVTVDHLVMAQFVDLILHNENIRSALDTLTSKVVLIVGRFSKPERKKLLDALREALRERDYVPVMFDFQKTKNRTTVETISTLAHMARFLIADLTDHKAVIQELQAIVPHNPSLVVQPLLLTSQDEPGMFDFFRAFQSVAKPVRYLSENALLVELDTKVLQPMEAKGRELQIKSRRSEGEF